MAETIDRTIDVLKTALLVNPRDATKHFMLGKAYRTADRLDDAVSCLKKASSLREGYAKADYHLGLTLEELNQHADAAAAFEACTNADADHLDAWLRQARMRALLQEHEASARAFEQVLRLEPGHPEAFRGAFDGWHDAGAHPHAFRFAAVPEVLADLEVEHAIRVAHTAEAVEAFDEATSLLRAIAERAPERVQTFDDLVRIMELTEAFGALLEDAARARALSGETRRHAASVGRAQLALENWAAAAEELDVAANAEGASARVKRDAGIAWAKSGAAERSLPFFQDAAPSRPDDLLLLVEWARARMALERNVEAKELLEQAVALPDTSAEAHSLLAQCLSALGDSDAANTAFQAALALNPHDARVQASYARNSLVGGDTSAAIEALARSTDLDSSNPTTWLLLGDQLLTDPTSENLERALHAYRQVLAVEPGSTPALRGAAQATVGLGRVADGIRACQAWAQSEPGLASEGELGRLLRRAERYAEAAQAFERALEYVDGAEGLADGMREGLADGMREGLADGMREGLADGMREGLALAETYVELGRTQDAQALLLRLRGRHGEALEILSLLAGVSLRLDDARGAENAAAATLRTSPKDVRLHRLRAEAQLALNDTAGAIASLEQALFLESTDLRSRLLLGETLRRAGRHEQAVACLREAVLAAGDNAEAHYQLGWALEQHGQAEPACAAYVECTQRDPRHADAYHRLGQLRLTLGRYEPACEALRAAVELEPDLAEAHSAHGQALEQLGDLDGALFSLRSALRLAPEHTLTLMSLGRVCTQAGRPQDAITYLTQALQRHPGAREPRLLLAENLFAVDRHAEALGALEHVLLDDPLHAPAQLLLAEHYRRTGDLERAVTALSAAVESEPENGSSLLNLARTLLESGDAEHALNTARRARHLDLPGDQHAELNGIIASALTRLGQHGAALGALEEALRTTPSLALAVDFARVVEATQDWPRAAALESALNQALAGAEADPSAGPVHRVLGRCAWLQARFQDALASFESAMRLNPDDDEAALGAGLARKGLGQLALAIPLLQRKSVPTPESQAALGEALVQEGQLDGGIAALEAAGDTLPPDAQRCLLWAYRNAGRQGDFERQARAILALEPDPLVAGALARAHYERGELTQVIELLSPLEAELGAPGLALLGIALSATGEHRQAVHRLRRATSLGTSGSSSLGPIEPAAHGALGISLVQEGLVEEGLSLIAAATRAGFDSSPAHRSAANAYRALGQHAPAAASMLAALRHDPDDAELRYECGLSFSRAGDPQQAMEQYRALRKMRPAMAERLFREVNG